MKQHYPAPELSCSYASLPEGVRDAIHESHTDPDLRCLLAADFDRRTGRANANRL